MKTYQTWRGLYSSHYFNHLDNGEWVDVTFIKYLRLKICGYTVRVLRIPKKGTYIEYPVKYQYGTIVWKGIVGHHDDGKHWYIKTKNSTLCAIK